MKKLFSLIIFSISVVVCHGQTEDPLTRLDSYGQETWVDSIFKAMTLDEKIGQLFMLPAYSNRDTQHQIDVENLIKKYHIGGLVFFQGHPRKRNPDDQCLSERFENPVVDRF